MPVRLVARTWRLSVDRAAQVLQARRGRYDPTIVFCHLLC